MMTLDKGLKEAVKSRPVREERRRLQTMELRTEIPIVKAPIIFPEGDPVALNSFQGASQRILSFRNLYWEVGLRILVQEQESVGQC